MPAHTTRSQAFTFGAVLGGLLAADERYALALAARLVDWALLGAGPPPTVTGDRIRLTVLAAEVPAAAWAAAATNALGALDRDAFRAYADTSDRSLARLPLQLSLEVLAGHIDPHTGAPGPLVTPPPHLEHAPTGFSVRWVLRGALFCHLAVPSRAAAPLAWEPPLVLDAGSRYWLGSGRLCHTSALVPTVVLELTHLDPAASRPSPSTRTPRRQAAGARFELTAALAAAGWSLAGRMPSPAPVAAHP